MSYRPHSILLERNKMIVFLMLSGKETLQSIADRYDCTRENIRRILVNEGVTVRHGFRIRADKAKQKAEVQYKKLEINGIFGQVAKDYENGAIARELVSKYSLSEWRINQIIKRSGIMRRKGGFASIRGRVCENTSNIIALSKQGFRFTEIVSELNLKPGHVAAVRYRHGLGNSDRRAAQHLGPRMTNWPYLPNWSKQSDTGADLMRKVNAVVPRNFPDHMRADICQELIVRILSGEINIDSISEAFPVVLTDFRRLHPFKFAPISLDAPIRATDSRTLHDILSADDIRDRVDWVR